MFCFALQGSLTDNASMHERSFFPSTAWISMLLRIVDAHEAGNEPLKSNIPFVEGLYSLRQVGSVPAGDNSWNN